MTEVVSFELLDNEEKLDCVCCKGPAVHSIVLTGNSHAVRVGLCTSCLGSCKRNYHDQEPPCEVPLVHLSIYPQRTEPLVAYYDPQANVVLVDEWSLPYLPEKVRVTWCMASLDAFGITLKDTGRRRGVWAELELPEGEHL